MVLIEYNSYIPITNYILGAIIYLKQCQFLNISVNVFRWKNIKMIYAAYFSAVSSETPLCRLKHTRYKLEF